MSKNNVLEFLCSVSDAKYKDFSVRLIPNISSESFIGVRTPILRHFAKNMIKSGMANAFIKELPHKYFEENQLHAFILSSLHDFDKVISGTEIFLPFVDNWATCDQMSPCVFKNNLDVLLPYVKKWIKSEKVYTVRFGIKTLMQYWLDDNFDKKYICLVADIKSDEYYVNMMRAWYFATGAAKQFESFLPFFKRGRIDEWTRIHAIQKACESFRVSNKNKKILCSLR